MNRNVRLRCPCGFEVESEYTESRQAIWVDHLKQRTHLVIVEALARPLTLAERAEA